MKCVSAFDFEKLQTLTVGCVKMKMRSSQSYFFFQRRVNGCVEMCGEGKYTVSRIVYVFETYFSFFLKKIELKFEMCKCF